MNDDIVERVLAEKRKAVYWRDSTNWCHLVSFLTLLLVAMVAIFGFDTQPGATMLLPLAGWPWPAWVWRWLRVRNKPRCPLCGFNWELKERFEANWDPNESILHWHNCPGCGIELDEHTLRTKYRAD